MTPIFALQVSLLERTWRYAWRRKGDVYHLLFDMSGYVDGRVWPAQDKTDVLLFLSLMHHVTGKQPWMYVILCHTCVCAAAGIYSKFFLACKSSTAASSQSLLVTLSSNSFSRRHV